MRRGYCSSSFFFVFPVQVITHAGRFLFFFFFFFFFICICLMQPLSNQTLVITISEHLQIECDEAFTSTIPCLVLFEAKPRGTVRNAHGTSRCYCDFAKWNRHTTSFVMNGERKIPRRCKTLQCRENHTEERLYTRNVIFDTFCYLFLYQSYPICNLFSRFLAVRNMYRGRYWVQNALSMMDRI